MRNASEVIRFGVFEVDLRTGELRRHGLRVRLPTQSFQVLQLLLEHPGGMVSREELREKLWPANTFVDFDHGVNAAVKRLREALGDSADNPRFVETLPRRGYRFIAPVEGNPDSGPDVREPEKDRPQRLGDMADARLEVEEALTASRSASPSAASVVTPARHASWLHALPWAITAVLGVGWILVLGRWRPWRTPSPPHAAQRLSVALGVNGTLPATDAPFALSPDGTLLAFVARTSGRTAQLYIRRLDQLMPTSLSGTEGASSPFFSPDGQWVAFFADLKLKKVPVSGGAVVTLAEAPEPRGGWWSEDDTIVFAPNNRVSLMRVSAVGGQVQPLTTLREGEITHRFPQVLPGGAAVLYTASTDVNIGAGATLVLQLLPSGERTIIQGGYFGRYVESGHIAYIQDDTLFVVPFDRQRLSVTGPAARAIERVRSDASRGSAQLAVSQTGTLVYLPGQNAFDARPIAWMDRTGTIAALRTVPADWSNPEFSPDGQRIAMDIRREGHSDIWVYDWARDTLTRVTSERTNEEHPVWTPDGERIIYRSFGSSTDPSVNTLSWKRADGTGDAQVLIQSKAALIPGSWHPTRNVLAYVATTLQSGDDVMILPVEGNESSGWRPGQPTAFLNSSASERGPTFSPDGRWLAYHSQESGRSDVYVRPFPGPGARVMVSSGGGETSSWSRTRPELVFTSPAVDYTRVLMVAAYRTNKDSFRADKPRLWSERGSALRFLLGQRNFALHPDGMRVAIPPPPEGEAIVQNHLTFVLNFFDELRHIAPGQAKR